MTNNQTRWDKYHNDVRLEERLIDIEKWRNELERVLSNTDREIANLQDFKDNCDHALAQKAIPESVNAECLGNVLSFINNLHLRIQGFEMQGVKLTLFWIKSMTNYMLKPN